MGSGQTVTIEDTDLIGHSGNNTSLVYVTGEFVMNGDSSVSGNTNSSHGGGGVYMGSGSKITMYGGTIYGTNETDPTLPNIATGALGGDAIYVNAADARYGDNTHIGGSSASRGINDTISYL